ncbi:prepilin peptidase, partial [Klebsiella pneumoniae]
AVWGAIGGYLAFGLIYWLYRGIRGREGIGYGDIKFLAALGAWHGWKVLPQLVLIAAILACAAVTALTLCTRTRQTLHYPLPFGPFLAAA